jgi:hypothetical protein
LIRLHYLLYKEIVKDVPVPSYINQIFIKYNKQFFQTYECIFSVKISLIKSFASFCLNVNPCSANQTAVSKWSECNAKAIVDNCCWFFCSLVRIDSRIVFSSSSNNNCNTSVCPWRAARWKHVSPFELHLSNSAPYSCKTWIAFNSIGLLSSPVHLVCIGVLPS